MDNPLIGPTGPNPVAEEQFRKGFEMAKQGDLDEAILAIEAATTISQEEPRYHDLLGSLYAKKGIYDMAVAEWKRSIECDPDHAEVFRRIETAEKMRVHGSPAGQRWNLGALLALAILFAVSLAMATYFYRTGSTAKEDLESAQSELASAKENMVEQAVYDALLQEKDQAQTKLQSVGAQFAELSTQHEQLKATSASRDELQKEQELRTRVQSELAASRKQMDELKAQLSAAGNAAGAQALTDQIAQKNTEIEALNKNYKTLNDDRKRLEDELAKSKTELTAQNAKNAELEKKSGTAATSGDSEKLAREVQSLKEQLAKAKPGGASPEVLFLLNSTLEAVRYTLEGKKEAAVAQLKKAQGKAPEGAAFRETIEALAPEEKPVEEPSKEPTVQSAPQPTAEKAKPDRDRGKAREREREKARPEPTATPKPKAKPTATPKAEPDESKRTVAEGVASPRAVRRLDGQPGKEGKPSAASTGKSTGDKSKELYETKKRLTEQALSLYRSRKFDEAGRLVNQAHRIDPKDPAVNQLREALREAQKP
jgi:hypothetical protein